MRVAYVINQYPQPSQSFIRREIRMLEALGVELTRITVRRWPGKLVDPGDLEERKNSRAILEHKPAVILATLVAAITRPVKFAKALAATWKLARRSHRGTVAHLFYLAEACLLQQWLADAKVDHVHAHFGTNSTSVVMLCRILGGPRYSFTIHGPEEFDSPYALSLDEKVRRSAFTVVIGRFGQSQLFRWTDYADWERIHLVRCGVDGAFLDNPPTTPPLSGRLVCVARLDEQKGQLVLVEAARLLRDRGVDFQLRFVGDGDLRALLESRVAAAGLGDRITFLGWKSAAEVRGEIESARALCLPSFAEGLPVVIMESLARHRPVISTTVAAIPELVRNGETGWVVPPASPEPLADAMQAALEASDEKLVEMGRRGAALVKANHDAKTEAAKLKALIEAAAASEPAATIGR